MVSPHRYSSHALLLLAMLFVTGCFAAASVLSLAGETADDPFSAAPTELLQRLDRPSEASAADKSEAVEPLPRGVFSRS